MAKLSWATHTWRKILKFGVIFSIWLISFTKYTCIIHTKSLSSQIFKHTCCLDTQNIYPFIYRSNTSHILSKDSVLLVAGGTIQFNWMLISCPKSIIHFCVRNQKRMQNCCIKMTCRLLYWPFLLFSVQINPPPLFAAFALLTWTVPKTNLRLVDYEVQNKYWSGPFCDILVTIRWLFMLMHFVHSACSHRAINRNHIVVVEVGCWVNWNPRSELSTDVYDTHPWNFQGVTHRSLWWLINLIWHKPISKHSKILCKNVTWTPVLGYLVFYMFQDFM